MGAKDTVWALVPVKPLHCSKQRLAGVLTPSECAGLAAAMLDDLLRVLESVTPISRIFVLTADPVVAADVEARGHAVIDEIPRRDLNAHLDAAAAWLGKQVSRLLVIHADLPAVTNQEIAEMLAAHQGGVTLAPAAVDGGTNAIITEPADALPFHFGPHSLARHRAAADKAGLACRVFQKPGLGRDLDRPDDLAWFLQQPLDTRAGAFLNELAIAARLSAALRDSA